MTSTQTSPAVPLSFLIAVFAAAIVVGGLIAYLGFTGVLGGPIP